MMFSIIRLIVINFPLDQPKNRLVDTLFYPSMSFHPSYKLLCEQFEYDNKYAETLQRASQ